MPSASYLAVALQPLLPLQINAVEFHEPSLTVIGERWSLAVVGEWAWHRGGVRVTGWDEPSAEDAVWDLCGSELVGVKFPNPEFDGDCSFSLSNGSLDVRSDRTGWETWTFHHDDLETVYVGL